MGFSDALLCSLFLFMAPFYDTIIRKSTVPAMYKATLGQKAKEQLGNPTQLSRAGSHFSTKDKLGITYMRNF